MASVLLVPGALAAAVVDLVVPRSCPLCRTSGPLCERCEQGLLESLFPGGPRLVLPDPGPAGLPPTLAAGRYEGALAEAVRAYKDDGRRDLAALLGLVLAGALGAGLARLGRTGPAAALVVPVPTSRSARRRRGDAPMRDLALAATAELERAGSAVPDARLEDALRVRRRVRDQVGLTADERAGNLTGALGVAPGVCVRGRTCVVVDDVVTTGATVAEAARALRVGGGSRVVAATVCATARRR